MTSTLPFIAEPKDERALLLDAVQRSARVGRVNILEAGCGQKWNLKPDGVAFHITGVDTDAEAMQIRREKAKDLDVAVVADLREVDLEPDHFDVVYCSYVLEHVDGAQQVLDRLAAAVRPGGRLIIRVPDGSSVLGYLAKHTPHITHVWFKKYVERFPDAGKPGHAPYPTVYDPVVSAQGLSEWASANGLVVETCYTTNHYIKKFGWFAPVVKVGLRLFAALSFGRLSADHNNVGFVFRKPA